MSENVSAPAGVDKRITLIIITLSSFVHPMLMFATNVALPSIGREFSLEAVLLSWVSNAYLLAAAALLIPIGRLADIYGLKKMFLWGFALLTVSSLFCAISNSAVLLLIFRALQGLSGAMTIGTAVAMLTSVFPAEERGRVLGINTGAVYLGLTLGPFIGGVLTQQFGWRSIFFLTAFLALVVFVVAFWRLKGEWAGARGEKYDVKGAVIMSLSVIIFMYGVSLLPSVTGIIPIVLGVVGMGFFVWLAGRTENPVFNIGLFRNNSVFAFSSTAVLLAYSAILGLTFFLSLYLQYIKAFSPQTAGLILITAPFIQVFVAPAAGRLSDRVEPRLVASVGIIFNTAALLMFVFLSGQTALWYIIAGLIIHGVGMGFFASPNTNAIMGSVEKKFLGIASGMIGTMRTTGQMLSMGIVMILFSLFIGNAEITPGNYPAFLTSVTMGFIIFLALNIIAGVAQFAGRRTAPGRTNVLSGSAR